MSWIVFSNSFYAHTLWRVSRVRQIILQLCVFSALEISEAAERRCGYDRSEQDVDIHAPFVCMYSVWFQPVCSRVSISCIWIHSGGISHSHIFPLGPRGGIHSKLLYFPLNKTSTPSDCPHPGVPEFFTGYLSDHLRSFAVCIPVVCSRTDDMWLISCVQNVSCKNWITIKVCSAVSIFRQTADDVQHDESPHFA